MRLKKQGLCLLLAALLLLTSGCGDVAVKQVLNYWTNQQNQAAYILDNGILRLALDGETSYFTLTDQRTGRVWTSVPEDAEDALADPSTQYRMQSTLLLTYCDKTGNTVTYDNYRYAIREGTFRIVPEDNALRVDYMIGPNERTYLVPEAVSEARMDELLSGMSQEDRSMALRIYLKLDPAKLKADRLKELTTLLPQLEEGTVYALPSAAGGKSVQDYQMEQLEAAFASVGYTEEDLALDSVSREKESTSIQFNVTVRYSLAEDGLRVEIPEEELSYPAEYPLTELTVLPWFCAAEEGAEGYLLVPDGGGAQIFFHNGKTAQNAYYANVYGWDEASTRETRIQETSAVFPVFGIVRDGGYLMAVAGEGAAEMAVEADVGGKRSSFDVVRPIFTVVHGEDTSVSAKSKNTVRVFQKDRPSETLTLCYFCGNSDSYVDMAERYRAYLEQTYPGFGAADEQGMPLVLRLLGAMDRTEKVVGVPIRVTTAATDYTEAAGIIENLSDVENLRVQYSAVLNGGLDQGTLLKAKRIRDLGSETERQALLRTVEDTGTKLYLGAYLQQVMNLSGFSGLRYGIRDTTDQVITRYPYSPDTQSEAESAGNKIQLMNLSAQQQAADVFAREAGNWEAGLAYLDLGNLLYSDFNRKTGASRDAFSSCQSEILKAQKAEGRPVMVSGGNEYAAAWADCVVDLPLEGSSYDITDRQIPFYQIALHGSVAYTAGPLNGAADEELRLLRSVETGAGLCYVFFETDYQELLYNSYTVFSTLYSANFKDREQELKDLYDRLNTELGHTASQRITGHSYLSDTLTCTEYADGTRVYVNYGTVPCTAEGVTVPPRDWLVQKGD